MIYRYFYEGRYQEALDGFEQVLELAPLAPNPWGRVRGSVLLLNYKGIALGRLGRLQEALLAFEQALALESENARSWRNKSIACSSLGRYKEALEASKQASARISGTFGVPDTKAAALLGLGRFRLATGACERALHLNLYYAYIQYGIGTMSRPGEARRRYQRASEINFGDLLVSGSVYGVPHGNFYQRELRRQEPIFHREAHRALAHASKAHILTGLKQYDEALTECAEALRRDPTLLAASGNQAYAYARLQLYEHALAVYEEVLREHPDHDHFLIGRAAVLLRLGSNEEARSTFTRAMEIRWRWPMVAAT